jgi:hypothetical protein
VECEVLNLLQKWCPVIASYPVGKIAFHPIRRALDAEDNNIPLDAEREPPFFRLGWGRNSGRRQNSLTVAELRIIRNKGFPSDGSKPKFSGK